MGDILYDGRWIGNHGIGRFAQEVYRAIPDLTLWNAGRRPYHPFDPWLLGSTLRHLQPRLYFSPGYNSPLGWPGRFVFTLHDLNHLCVPANSNALKRAYYRYVIKPACHRAKFVLTVSEYSRHEIAQWAKVSAERVINVGNGVGYPFSPEGPKYEPGFPYLLYVGSHKPHKNLLRLLRAYANTGLQQDTRLLITGNPGKDISRLVQGLRLENAVVFVNPQENEELATLYRGAIALVFPSLYEGFGLPPLEAMACGIPVLTSNVCSLPEIVGDAAILVDPLSVDDIAQGIRRLVEDSELRERLRERGLLRSKKFCWTETARRTSQVLALALARN